MHTGAEDEAAIEAAAAQGIRTRDVGGKATPDEVTAAVIASLPALS
ncbi:MULTISPECIES: hypothetical protein [Glycomyces]|uniref:Isocitrate/isopropylmalate dehydrogenase n=2 Tax=Glycomyces TaxID=58113 RepID=A0A9X3SUK5_9ACTN|nr:hypothetical protein [Glycomyces lechevalierae]MDA1383732.1 hypothetical protein [Glycomyces lechevalierae]MDR7341277.1 isocitrate/isopropylmalate dehydrogenase [Glycomyces lechevalierae]